MGNLSLTSLHYWAKEDTPRPNAHAQLASADGATTQAVNVVTVAERIDLIVTLKDEQRLLGLRQLFSALAAMDEFGLASHRADICKRLNLGAREFDRLLREARKQSRVQLSLTTDRYTIEGARLCAITYDRSGQMVIEPLCNWTARITAEVVRDDGRESTMTFAVEGADDHGAPLPKAVILASEFENVARWSVNHWGARAVVRAGVAARDRLREAIQLVSLQSGIERQRVFTHTGWRIIDGKRVFLTASGALGADNIQVELEGERMARYALPPMAERTLAAIQVSLILLDVGTPTITVPLWAAMYLAPLGPILAPDFVLWAYGQTGQYKSAVTALFLSHFGKFNHENLPAQWGDTANELEKLMFIGKDVPLVIDDFAPQASGYRAQELEDKAQRIVRAVGNRSGRGRLTRELKTRNPFDPRGLVVSTGEQLPQGQSIMGRMLAIEFAVNSVNVERLSAGQATACQLPQAMAGYIRWLAEEWDDLERKLPARFEVLRAQYQRGSHARMAGVVALLHIGLEMGLGFATQLGALSPEKREDWLAIGEEALNTVAVKHAARIGGESPALRFLRFLGEMLVQGKIYFDGRASHAEPLPSAELMGWQDQEHFYLIPDAAYHRVSAHFREENGHFPLGRNELYRDLDAEGYLIKIRGDHTGAVTIWGKSQRVLQLDRGKVEAVWGSLPDV